jgi:hypothetical protein
MDEIEEIKPTDIYTQNKVAFVKTLKNTTGYPDNLTPEQICRLIYFFGARKLDKKAAGVTALGKNFVDKFSEAEKLALKDYFKWFGYEVPDKRAFRASYNALTIKFKNILEFLRTHPAYITPEIYQAIKTGGYDHVISNVVLVIDENRKVVPRLVDSNFKKDVIPLGQMETMMWQIQSISLEKMKMILDNITIKDIKKANLGIKSKALRDIYAMIHMIRQANKNPNLTLINLNINASGTKEKLATYSEYLVRNKEET